MNKSTVRVSLCDSEIVSEDVGEDSKCGQDSKTDKLGPLGAYGGTSDREGGTRRWVCVSRGTNGVMVKYRDGGPPVGVRHEK